MTSHDWRWRCPRESPFEKLFRVVQRQLPAWSVRNGVERMFGPWNCQQHRRGTRGAQPIVKHRPESWQYDVIAAAVDQQRRWKSTRHISDRRCLAVAVGHLLWRSSKKRGLNRPYVERIRCGRIAVAVCQIDRTVVADNRPDRHDGNDGHLAEFIGGK